LIGLARGCIAGFDVDGAGGAEAVKFAAVDPGTSLTADDFFVL
jgi:hypothetical protein